MTKRIALVVATTLVVAACGSNGDAGDETTTTAPDTTTTQEATTTEATGGSVMVASSDLGDILVDGDGNTLYLFVPDDRGASTCYEACAQTWPPLTGEATAGDGVDAALLGTTERDDGTVQATYNGWPLYYFANDTAPGDTNGQGINDIWYVIDPAGEAITG